MSSLALTRTGAPLIQLWFGNFFEPWLSDRSRMSAALAEVRSLGFNAITLDSKPWTDFFSRYRGGPASPYVAMQEFMMAQRHGLGHSFLAVYLNGDNLYPTMRPVPPVRGEDALGVDGRSLDTYLYWSEKAQASMVEHVAGLMRLYSDGHVRFAGTGPVLPMHTMFDPIVKPSFDAESRLRYLDWLGRRYHGDLAALNHRYGCSATSFQTLQPEEYWLRPEELTYCTCAYPSPADFRDRTPALWRWLDNQTWLAEETEAFFATMQGKFRQLDPGLFLLPVLAQWGMFLTPPNNRWWDTATRAIDPYRLAHYVDAALFIAAPLNPEDDADPSALSVEISIQRNANAGRAFLAGLFLGRHVHRDLNRAVPPSEAIGTAAVHGAAGLHVYGYGGADDGGVVQHLDAGLKASLASGNRWATRVLPLLAGQRRLTEAAILFPRATQLFEPMLSEEGRQHRMDLIGWYRQLSDLGFNVDILHPDQVKAGLAAGYRLLILPTDACYDLAPDTGLEAALATWVEAGGCCVHGAACTLANAAFGIRDEQVAFDCITLGEGRRVLIPEGWTTTAFPEAERLASYHRLGGTAIGLTRRGKGEVLSVGFPYGFAYATRRQPVPRGYHSEVEAIGVQLLDHHPVVDRLRALAPLRWNGGRGIEVGWFERSVVVVNHRSTPIRIDDLATAGPADWQVEAGGWLIPHAAVHLPLIVPSQEIRDASH